MLFGGIDDRLRVRVALTNFALLCGAVASPQDRVAPHFGPPLGFVNDLVGAVVLAHRNTPRRVRNASAASMVFTVSTVAPARRSAS